MSRCRLCHRWIWPWQHFAFRGAEKGRWHVECYQNVQRIFEEDADRWEQEATAPRRSHAAWCYLPLDHMGLCEGDQ